MLQGERFDPTGAYVRRWVPELARLPDRWLQQPEAAPAAVLAQAGVVLGRDYPRPIIDFRTSREQALAGYAMIRGPLGLNPIARPGVQEVVSYFTPLRHRRLARRHASPDSSGSPA